MHTYTHVWKCPSHQLECDIRDLTKTSWPGSPSFNKLQLRVDTASVCLCACVFRVAPPAIQGRLYICVDFFISCSCEADIPLSEHGSSPLRGGKGSKWVCWECVCVLTNGTEKSWNRPHLLLITTALLFSSLYLYLPSSPPQLWVIKSKGKQWKGGRLRGGDRVLTHRLSNSFQRSTDCLALCSTRANQEWRLYPFGQCKGGPTPVREKDMALPPSFPLHHRTQTVSQLAPQTPQSAWQANVGWERTRKPAKTETNSDRFEIEKGKPENSTQGDPWKASVQLSGSCGVLVSRLCVPRCQTDCGCLVGPRSCRGRPIVFI